MRRFALLVVAGGLASWGLVAAIEGCGGDAEAIPSPPDGSVSDESTSGGTSGGSSGTSGSSGDPDGGGSSSGNTPTSNPGKLTCGAVECDAGALVNAPVCCVRDGGAAPVCTRANQCDDNGDLALACDEPADCVGGIGNQPRPCCLRLPRNGGPGPGGGRPRSECSIGNGCGDNGIRLCKSTADCGDAGACTEKKCGPFTGFVCGSPQGCE